MKNIFFAFGLIICLGFSCESTNDWYIQNESGSNLQVEYHMRGGIVEKLSIQPHTMEKSFGIYGDKWSNLETVIIIKDSLKVYEKTREEHDKDYTNTILGSGTGCTSEDNKSLIIR